MIGKPTEDEGTIDRMRVRGESPYVRSRIGDRRHDVHDRCREKDDAPCSPADARPFVTHDEEHDRDDVRDNKRGEDFEYAHVGRRRDKRRCEDTTRDERLCSQDLSFTDVENSSVIAGTQSLQILME